MRRQPFCRTPCNVDKALWRGLCKHASLTILAHAAAHIQAGRVAAKGGMQQTVQVQAANEKLGAHLSLPRCRGCALASTARRGCCPGCCCPGCCCRPLG